MISAQIVIPTLLNATHTGHSNRGNGIHLRCCSQAS